MSYRYSGKNIRPFTAICDCKFGRKVIVTKTTKIAKENIVNDLDYLNNYCKKEE